MKKGFPESGPTSSSFVDEPGFDVIIAEDFDPMLNVKGHIFKIISFLHSKQDLRQSKEFIPTVYS